MIVTTIPAVEGRKIVAYKGIVFGEVVSGVNFIKDMFSSITDMIGGRSGTYEKELQEAREKALAEMLFCIWKFKTYIRNFYLILNDQE